MHRSTSVFQNMKTEFELSGVNKELSSALENINSIKVLDSSTRTQ